MNESTRKRNVQRVQLACLPCRAGKLKCNRASPVCDQCEKRGRDDACTYTDRGLRYNAARQNAEQMRRKLDRLEKFVTHLQSSGSGSQASANIHDNTPDQRSTAIETTLPDFGKLKLCEAGGTQYVGPSHWESIIEDIGDVRAFLDDQAVPAAPGASYLPEIDVHLRVPLMPSNQELLANLPPRWTMDKLVAAWFHPLESLRLVLHAPTFQAEYMRFWQSPAETSTAWIALLSAVASLGAVMLGQTAQDPVALHQADALHRLTAHALVLADYARLQPYIIETLLLHIKGMLLTAHDVTTESYLLLGLLTRLCTRAGYHRDPRHNAAIDSFKAEMRRRVWAGVREYDILMCCNLGLLSTINHVMTDTAAPSNLSDSDLSATPIRDPRPLDDLTPMTFVICYGKLVSIFADVVSSSNAPTQSPVPELSKLEHRLLQARDDLPSQLRMVSLNETPLDPLDLILNRYRLEFLHLKALCILYRRFLGLSGFEDQERCCLKAARSLIDNQAVLLRACQAGGMFDSAMVFIARHVHDFNLAAVLICSVLKRTKSSLQVSPISEEAWQLIPSILQVCRLWDDVGILSSKARSALHAVESFSRQHLQATRDDASKIFTSASAENDEFSPGWQSNDPPALHAGGEEPQTELHLFDWPHLPAQMSNPVAANEVSLSQELLYDDFLVDDFIGL